MSSNQYMCPLNCTKFLKKRRCRHMMTKTSLAAAAMGFGSGGSAAIAALAASAYATPAMAQASLEREASLLGEDGPEEQEDDVPDVWKPYVCRSLDFGRPHPGSIVEGTALASVSLPSNSYPLQDSLAQQIADGSLSSMQLEGVMYACERHSRCVACVRGVRRAHTRPAPRA
jgi:hypothetical protein